MYGIGFKSKPFVKEVSGVRFQLFYFLLLTPETKES